MGSWIESLLDVEDMRRRCVAHAQWMADHPEAVWLAEVWADRNLVDLQGVSPVFPPGQGSFDLMRTPGSCRAGGNESVYFGPKWPQNGCD
jgi:hypothetical protein